MVFTGKFLQHSRNKKADIIQITPMWRKIENIPLFFLNDLNNYHPR